jgi:hypothetical protein
MFFGDILLAFLTVVPSRIEIFLLEPFGHQIKRQALNVNRKCGKSVSKQMGFEDHWLSCARLKHHPVHQKTETGGNGLVT